MDITEAQKLQAQICAIEEILRQIRMQFGVDFLREDARLTAVFADLAPKMERERKLLRDFLSCHGNTILLEAQGLPEEEFRFRFDQLVHIMCDDLFLTDAASRMICSAFAFSLDESRDPAWTRRPLPTLSRLWANFLSPFCDVHKIVEIQFLSSLGTAPAQSADLSEARDGSVRGWTDEHPDGYVLYIAGEGGVAAPQDSSELFSDYESLKTVRCGTCFDTSNVTNMAFMFCRCSNLAKLDVSGWNTANVTRMSGVFFLCKSLTALDVAGWDTANVTDMSNMFANCRKLTMLDVSGWNTAHVTDMAHMFENCNKLNMLDVSGWNTARVMTMYSMFMECESLSSLDVSRWDTSSVYNMNHMFFCCLRLNKLDVSNWNTSNVNFMTSLFSGCFSLTNLDVSGWNTDNVTNMDSMFENCPAGDSVRF